MNLTGRNRASSIDFGVFEKSLKQVEREMRELRDKKLMTKGEQRSLGRNAANILKDAMERQAPKLKAGYRQWLSSLFAGDGHYRTRSGHIVAFYTAANLKRSQKVIAFRRSPHMWVGGKLAKGNPDGLFSGRQKVDAYYGHWLDSGSSPHKITVKFRRGNKAGTAQTFRVRGTRGTAYVSIAVRKARPAVIARLRKDYLDALPGLVARARAKAGATTP